MITFVRTITYAAGKNAEIMSLTRLVKKHLAEKYGIELRACMPFGGGDPSRVSYLATFESLAEYEQASLKLLGDQDYLKLLAAYAPHVFVGPIQDQLWRDI